MEWLILIVIFNEILCFGYAKERAYFRDIKDDEEKVKEYTNKHGFFLGLQLLSLIVTLVLLLTKTIYPLIILGMSFILWALPFKGTKYAIVCRIDNFICIVVWVAMLYR